MIVINNTNTKLLKKIIIFLYIASAVHLPLLYRAVVYTNNLAHAAGSSSIFSGTSDIDSAQVVNSSVNADSIDKNGTLNDAAAEAVKLTEEPKINAASAIVIDVGSGRVLYEKNAYAVRPMASTTKIMTGIIAIEEGNPDDLVTISQRAASVGGSNLNLQKGKQYRLEELIYGLLMKSGNDAAIAIAEHIGGTVDGFLFMMNEKARLLGARNTQFRTPHGLDADGHHSTAYDLALISRYALQNETFSKIVSTHVAVINGHHWENTNEMLDNYPGADGVKTGYTGKAGRCLVTSATRGDLKLISVVLFCDSKSQRAASSRKILDYAFDNYRLTELIRGGTFIADLPVIRGKGDTVAVRIAESLAVPVSEKDLSQVDVRFKLSKDINAPVYAGIDVGTAQIFSGDELLGEVKLKTWEDVGRKTFFDNLGDVFDNWFKLIKDGF